MGGGGQDDVEWICRKYIEDLNDPLMDMDVCRVMVTGTTEHEDIIRANWRQLGDREHPRLTAARAYYVMQYERRPKTPAEMEQALNVLRE